MALNGNFRDGTLVVKDGTGTPLEVTIVATAGDFSFSGMKLDGASYETIVTQARGELHSLRKGNRAFPTISFNMYVSEFSLATGENLLCLVAGTDDYSARVSTTAAKGDVMTFDLEFTTNLSGLTGGTSTTITFEDVELTLDFSEGEQNSVSVSGTVYGNISRSVN